MIDYCIALAFSTLKWLFNYNSGFLETAFLCTLIKDENAKVCYCDLLAALSEQGLSEAAKHLQEELERTSNEA